MNEEWSQHAAIEISHWAQIAAENIRQCAADAAHEQMRPSTLMRPAVSVDGNQWCALYGEDLQRGVAGFGDSPALAMLDFDREWAAKLRAQSTQQP